MKYAVIIEAENAIRDNGNQAGLVTAEIDLPQFTAEERTELIERNTNGEEPESWEG